MFDWFLLGLLLINKLGVWDSIDFSCGHVMGCNGLGIPGSASHWQMSLGTMALVVDSSFSDGVSQLLLNIDRIQPCWPLI